MNTEMTKRSPIIRFIAFIFWAIIIFLATNFITGIIVAALVIPNDPQASQEILMAQAQEGLGQFFDQYGIILHSGQFVVTVLLSFFGLLPWTGKTKKVK